MEYAYPPDPPIMSVPTVIYGVLIGVMLVSLILSWLRTATIWPSVIFVAVPIIEWALLEVFPKPPVRFDLTRPCCLILTILGVSGLMMAYFRYYGRSLGAIVIFISLCASFLMLLPAMNDARRVLPRMECLNNLRNIIVALQNYASVNDGFMPRAGTELSDLSWRVQLLPLMDESALYQSYHRDKPWNDASNDEFAKIWIKAYSCPSNPNLKDSQGRYYTAYALMTGPGTAFDGPQTMSLDELGFGPGLSQTMLIGEACGANIVWNEPREIDVARERPGVNLPGKSQGTSSGWLSTYHKDQANIAFADGAVKSISMKIDPEVLKAMASVDPAEKSKIKTTP